MVGGGLIKEAIFSKFFCFGTNGVTIFQGTKIGITQQIFNDYVLHIQGIQCMVHHTNLVVQVLSKLNMVNKLENLFQTLYAYFYKSPKRHSEFIKLTKIMETCLYVY